MTEMTPLLCKICPPKAASPYSRRANQPYKLPSPSRYRSVNKQIRMSNNYG